MKVKSNKLMENLCKTSYIVSVVAHVSLHYSSFTFYFESCIFLRILGLAQGTGTRHSIGFTKIFFTPQKGVMH